jgi:hypothetical protein
MLSSQHDDKSHELPTMRRKKIYIYIYIYIYREREREETEVKVAASETSSRQNEVLQRRERPVNLIDFLFQTFNMTERKGSPL